MRPHFCKLHPSMAARRLQGSEAGCIEEEETTGQHQMGSTQRAPFLSFLIGVGCPVYLLVPRLVEDVATITLVINTVMCLFGGSFLVAMLTCRLNVVARIWSNGLLFISIGWAAYLALMPATDLATITARDPETRDSVRMAYFMCGVVHASLSKHSVRWRVLCGTISLVVTLVGDSFAFCLRLHDLSLIRLPLLNVCIPSLVGFSIAAAVMRDSADSTGKRLRTMSAMLADSERRGAELEQARWASLYASKRTRLAIAKCEHKWDEVSVAADWFAEATPLAVVIVDAPPPQSPPPGPPSSQASAMSADGMTDCPATTKTPLDPFCDRKATPCPRWPPSAPELCAPANTGAAGQPQLADADFRRCIELGASVGEPSSTPRSSGRSMQLMSAWVHAVASPQLPQPPQLPQLPSALQAMGVSGAASSFRPEAFAHTPMGCTIQSGEKRGRELVESMATRAAAPTSEPMMVQKMWPTTTPTGTPTRTPTDFGKSPRREQSKLEAIDEVLKSCAGWMPRGQSPAEAGRPPLLLRPRWDWVQMGGPPGAPKRGGEAAAPVAQKDAADVGAEIPRNFLVRKVIEIAKGSNGAE